jgi:hypothetical protein
MSAAQKQFFSFIRDFSLRSTTISVHPDKYNSVAYVPLYYPEMSFHILEKELVKVDNSQVYQQTERSMGANHERCRDAKAVHIQQLQLTLKLRIKYVGYLLII